MPIAFFSKVRVLRQKERESERAREPERERERKTYQGPRVRKKFSQT